MFPEELMQFTIAAYHDTLHRQAAQERLARLARQRSPRLSLRWRVGAAGRLMARWFATAEAPVRPDLSCRTMQHAECGEAAS